VSRRHARLVVARRRLADALRARERRCVACGCTDAVACVDGCYWAGLIEVPSSSRSPHRGICSRCFKIAEQWCAEAELITRLMLSGRMRYPQVRARLRSLRQRTLQAVYTRRWARLRAYAPHVRICAYAHIRTRSDGAGCRRVTPRGIITGAAAHPRRSGRHS
jgi:hypothetical protein